MITVGMHDDNGDLALLTRLDRLKKHSLDTLPGALLLKHDIRTLDRKILLPHEILVFNVSYN
jgi:hypothetical protein